MPWTGIDSGVIAFADEGGRSRNYRRRDAPNHNRPWSEADENELLGMFRTGSRVEDLAIAFGRTTGSINARLAMLLGIRYPDTPNLYRRRGAPIERRYQRERTPVPREDERQPPVMNPLPNPEWGIVRPNELLAPAWRPYTIGEVSAEQASPPATPPAPSAPIDLWEFPSPAVSRIHRPRPARARDTTPVETGPSAKELPDHLQPGIQLLDFHRQQLAAEIKAARPATTNGRIAAAQHSALNKLAYQLASKFEGSPAFDRARWLEACGVQTAQRS